jgi:hypothetical protein
VQRIPFPETSVKHQKSSSPHKYHLGERCANKMWVIDKGWNLVSPYDHNINLVFQNICGHHPSQDGT